MDSSAIRVKLIISNNESAKVLERANSYNIPAMIFTKKALNTNSIINYLEKKNISFIILAGFLLKIPKRIINQYPRKIINIHPSLLPLYGGKGMYGIHVHQKVFESNDHYSGITIHFVNESYDDGDIIFQAKCPIGKGLKPKGIQRKVHELEMRFFPMIIEKLINGSN